MQNPVLTVMVKAARAGGNIILRHLGKLDSLNVVEKARMDFASEVDRNAEAEILKELKRAYPQAGFMAEESGYLKTDAKQLFVIDPLDGTSNFLRGFPHFCVSIALVERGEPTAALIYDPLRNEIFAAYKGGGATLNDRKIRIAERKVLNGAVVITGFPPRVRAHNVAHLQCIQGLLQTAEDVRRTGSAALDLAYVACGRADAYFEAGVKPWDIAGGMLLVREAGGRVCDFDGRGEKLLESSTLVAGNLKICDALQKHVVASGYATPFR